MEMEFIHARNLSTIALALNELYLSYDIFVCDDELLMFLNDVNVVSVVMSYKCEHLFA